MEVTVTTAPPPTHGAIEDAPDLDRDTSYQEQPPRSDARGGAVSWYEVGI